MIRVKEKHKRFMCYALIFVVFLMLGNTNNNADPFIQRMLRPLEINSVTIYYALFIPICILYYSLRYLSKISDYWLINTVFQRVITVFILISLFSSTWELGIKMYKSTLTGLDSIYLDYNSTAATFEFDQEKLDWSNEATFTNCGDDVVTFQVKLKVVDEYDADDILNEFVNTQGELEFNQIIEIQPNSDYNLVFEETFLREIKQSHDEMVPYSGNGSRSHSLSYVLHNDTEEIQFINSKGF